MLKLVTTVFALFPFFAQGLSLDQLQKVLIETEASWTAAKTAYSDFSFAEKKEMLGLRDEVEENSFSYDSEDDGDGDLPDVWDWRSVEGKNYDTAMRYQGRCGSCVAFATTAAVEIEYNIAGRTADFDLDFSEQHLFHCGGGSCQTGWWASSGLLYFQKSGVPDEACFPYISANIGENPVCTKSCSDAKDRLTFIKGFRPVSNGSEDIEKIKKALTEGPLLTTMRVYEDFYFYSGGVYEYKTGKLVGGHAITMVGYDVSRKAWLVKNSWGNEWGEKGYFFIKWGDISGLGKSTFRPEVDPINDYLKVVRPNDYDVLSGNAAIELDNHVSDATSLSYVLKGKRTISIEEDGLESDGSSFLVNTTNYPDGVYDLYVEAKKGEQTFRSPHRIVYIVNSTPASGLRLTDPANGSTVSDKILLTYECADQKIPFTTLTTIVEGNGVKKEFDVSNPCPKIQVRLRTYTVPNGEYKVYGIGKIGTIVNTASEPVTLIIAN